MKKKLLILVISLALLTGCSAEYNLTISENGYNEEVILKSENNNDNNIISQYEKPLEQFVDSANSSETLEKVEGIDYYEMEKYLENNLNNLKFTADFTRDNYIKSNIATHSVSIFKTYQQGKVYQIFAGSYFKCFEMNNGINNLVIRIILSDDYEIVESNADTSNNNVFTWNINKSDYKDKSIHFYYKKKDLNNSSSSNSRNNSGNQNNNKINTKTSSYALYIFCGVLIIIILLGYFLFNKMKNKNNKLDD